MGLMYPPPEGSDNMLVLSLAHGRAQQMVWQFDNLTL